MGRVMLCQVHQMPDSLVHESEVPFPALLSEAILRASAVRAGPLRGHEAEIRVAPVINAIVVPEPGTLSLVVLGLVVLAVGATVGRRRRSRESGRWPRRKHGRTG